MLFSRDMQDLLEIFERRGVDYALVGGYAVNIYGYNRATQDIDLLVKPSPANASRIMAALEEFGFGGAGIPKEYFEKEGSAIHLGSEPNRIDLLTCLEGASNEQIFSRLDVTTLGSLAVKIISFNDLVEVKKRSGRLKDNADAEELLRIARI